ncbi:MAG TPA: FCD domain-containing protein, partial [Halomonas sp.]|nr:FCD domain-containing protein [Halomonas sp.]
NATPISRLIDQHTAIVTAIEARDVDAAKQAMHLHQREILKSLPDLVQRFPEMFETQQTQSLVMEAM